MGLSWHPASIQLDATALLSLPRSDQRRIGPRFQTLPSADGSKTVLPSAITVRNVDHVYEYPHRPGLLTSTGKKLKRRLEDLKKGSDTNSNPMGAENQAQAPRKETKRQSMKSDSNVASYKAPQPESQCIPPMYIDYERLFPPLRDTLKRSHTPPCTAYPNLHPLPDEMMLSLHGIDVPYDRPTTAEAYMAITVPCALPSITHFIDAINGELLLNNPTRAFGLHVKRR